ncbi:predicted protein [Chaetoceros tenuissimus]|uniref:Uncharacterized protein n=1 Tax=Chaetoceros tenuissimus TaxID=426638 RepID=A0AAD3CGK6_9STRA|nr:predicted protein [Chaetoceros tenuissimus]
MKARLKWTSRRQLHAAKAIVCASRLFLSRKELERRKLNHCSPSSAAFDANLGNVKRLFEVKLDAVSSSKIKNEQHRSRLQQRKEIILQIVKTIDFQSKFLQKVEEQSKCLQGVKDETLCLLDLNVAKAKDCQEILRREIAVNPNEFFQSWAQRHMDDFDRLLSIYEKIREGIKAKEKERLETDMFVLQSSQRLTFQKVETLWALEGYESEIYSFEHEKSKDISVTDATIKYLDRTANCISSTEACLEKLYGESLLFYEKQEESMSNVVIFQKDPSIQCVAKESARDRLGKLSFDVDAWTKRYESKPWLIQQERHYSLQRIRKTFDHIDIRREDLLAKGTQKRSTEDTPKQTAERSKAYKGVGKALSLFHRVKASSKLGDAKVRMQNSVKSFSRAIHRKSQIDCSKDDEFQTILANVRRDLVQENGKCAVGVASLKFTVGEDESDLFSKENESNIALGKPYYSIQLNLGNVMLWLHLSKKKAGLITDLMIVSNKDQNISSNQEIVSHPLLQGGILITRDNRKPKVVSNLQIVYAHSNQGCSKGYDRVDGALDVLGEVSPGQMFAKKKNRLENSDNVSLSRMQKDLVELKKKQKHLSNDVLLKEMVDELEKRIAEMTPFREERGTSHLDYIVDYLALDSKTVLRLDSCRRSRFD